MDLPASQKNKFHSFGLGSVSFEFKCIHNLPLSLNAGSGGCIGTHDGELIIVLFCQCMMSLIFGYISTLPVGQQKIVDVTGNVT